MITLDAKVSNHIDNETVVLFTIAAAATEATFPSHDSHRKIATAAHGLNAGNGSLCITISVAIL